MSSIEYTLLVIAGAGIATWLSRVFPFILLKKFHLSKGVLEYLSFVPVVIMSALWFSSLFNQHLGSLPTLDVNNTLASLPTILAAIISKNLLVIVVVGIISLGIIQMIL